MTAPIFPRIECQGRRFPTLREALQWAGVHARGRVPVMQKDDALSPWFVVQWANDNPDTQEG